MSFKLVICTNNLHKYKEILPVVKSIISDEHCSVHLYEDFYDKPFFALEDGRTFHENAMKKVADLDSQEGVIFFAEDSGLEVHALSGAPGIFSARYGGENLTDKERCQFLLQEMEGILDRRAVFKTVVALKYPSSRVECFSGTIEGVILSGFNGENGFGYDPLFQPKGEERTFSKMSLEEKSNYSHRAVATKCAMKTFLDTFLLNE